MDELNPTNAFGELLLDLIDAQYGGDYDSGIQALMQAAGLSEEEAVGIIQGDVIVENEQLLSGIISAFPDADEDDIEVIINVADGVNQEDRDDLIGQIEADEMAEGGQEDMGQEMAEEPEMAGAAYGYSQANTATFQAAQHAIQRANEVESKWANFEATNFLAGSLRHIDNVATQHVQAGSLPPSYKALLIGNFGDDSTRIARFSQMASENGVDVATMLFATQYALGMLTDAADFVEFKDYSVTSEDVAMANFSASLDSTVSADLDAIFNN